jgi:hypothetical protein
MAWHFTRELVFCTGEDRSRLLDVDGWSLTLTWSYDACARGCAEWSLGVLAGYLYVSLHEVASIIMYIK